jgi:hypothetical protein
MEMADGKRPGGLTALAVLNFVFGGLGLLGLLALFALMKGVETAASAAAEGGDAAGAEVVNAVSTSAGPIYLALGLGLLSTILLIVAGIGYLGQKRFMGRTLGTVYALLAIGGSVVSLVLLKQGFGLSTIIGLVYPVLTLILLNTTFKDDLVN